MEKIAIIGIGRWGKILLEEFSEISDVKLCHFLGNTNNAHWLRRKHPKIKPTQDLNDILKSDVDAVVVATPVDTHFEIVHRLLQNNKSVFVEKPLSTTKNNAMKLIRLAKKKKLLLFVGHVFLYHPVLKKIKQILKNDPIQFARFDWNKLGTFDDDIFFNLLSHEISVILELFGETQRSQILFSQGTVTNADQLIAHFDVNENQKCLVTINRTANFKNKSVFLKTDKRILLWENDSLFEFNKKNQNYKLIFKTKQKPLRIECKQFLKNLKAASHESNRLDNAYKVVQILEKLSS